MALKQRHDDAFFRSLPFDQRLARMALASINSGPDGVKSMSQCQCSSEVYEVKGYERFYDDFKLVDKGFPYHVVQKSPLMALPKKIRAKIYGYAVAYDQPIPICLHTTTMHAISKETMIVRKSGFFNPPLLRACRKVEKDAAPLFYANNSFKADITDGDTSTLMTWLTSTDPAYLALVSELVITLEPRSYFDIIDLRHAAQDGNTSVRTHDLAATLIEKGITADKIFMTSPEDMKHLNKDVMLMGRSVTDTEQLREKRFDELQKWLDCEEYGIDGERYEETAEVEVGVTTGTM